MNKSISIALDEVSFDVALLHQILAVLESEVVPTEGAERRAGPDTKEKVRALQAQLGVPVDERRIVDPRTAMALQRLLKERALVESTGSFTVAGQARRTDGTPGRQQRLLAFDLDLRAVGVYRTIKAIAEMDKNGGFEFLAETVSDGDGRYSVTFYDWQYRRAERKDVELADFAPVAEASRGIERSFTGGRP